MARRASALVRGTYAWLAIAGALLCNQAASAATTNIAYNIDPANSLISANVSGGGTIRLVGGTLTVRLSASTTILFQITGSGSAVITIGGATANATIPNSVLQQSAQGQFTLTGQDDVTDSTAGVLSPSVPGQDGKFDDGTNNNSQFDIAAVSGLSATATGNVPVPISVTGGTVSGSGGGNITVAGFLTVPVTVGVNGSVGLANAAISGLGVVQSGSASVLGGVPTTTPNTFPDGSHPFLPGNIDNLAELSVVQPSLTASGAIVADVTGNLNASVTASILGIPISLFNQNVLNGLVSQLNVPFGESLDLPILMTTEHIGSPNVDYDDSKANISASTFGQSFTLPLTLSSSLPFNTNFSYTTSGLRALGTISGTFLFDVNASLTAAADVQLKSTLNANTVNVPEVSVLAISFAASGCFAGFWVRKRMRSNA